MISYTCTYILQVLVRFWMSTPLDLAVEIMVRMLHVVLYINTAGGRVHCEYLE